MSAVVTVSGGGRMDVPMTVHLTCMDCQREANAVIRPPSSYEYGGSGRGRVYLGHMPYPEGWNSNINQLDRCADCYERHLERMRPEWAAEAAARRAELLAKSPQELIALLMNGAHPSSGTWDALKALRDVIGPQSAVAVDPAVPLTTTD